MGQIQIDPAKGLTFVRAIRAILRQDPDVIMVGEIRDMEALQACIQCAMTGHLVLTTLHTNTAVGAIRRILDIGVEPFMVNAGLSAVIGQRLVRVLCPKCRKPVKPSAHSLPTEAIEFIAKMGDGEFFGPDTKGCDRCGGGRGYKGRTSINEILVMNDRLRQLISEGADMATIQQAACESGAKTMLTNGLEKAARGITSVEEVIRVVPHGVN
jgi:type II secretory ATPase GspE/PulE/Tfp pilus assembly ATPase PilB-like protein